MSRPPPGQRLLDLFVFVAGLLAVSAVGLSLVMTLGHVNFAPPKREIVRRDLKALQGALKLYRARHGRLPSSEQGFQRLVDATILDSCPLDPWGHPYAYALRAEGPRVWTLGADGVEGGADDDADASLPGNP